MTYPPVPDAPPPGRPRPPVRVEPDGERLVPERWLDQAPVTRALLALNLAVFLVQVVLTHHVVDLPTRTALELGALYPLATVGEFRWETLLTACFLHDGIAHVGMNMLVLWQAGPLVERSVGPARMAPMYLAAGVVGNLASTAYGWITRAGLSVGASGAISGVIASALVVAWRAQGFRSPLTRGLLQWLGFIVVFGVFTNLSGGRIDNAAHIGGAIAGAAVAAVWKRGHRHSEAATNRIVAACAGVLVACILVVAFRDRTDRFATMTLQERAEFTREALADGRCHDARDGLLAVERLRARMAPVTSLRGPFENICGRTDH